MSCYCILDILKDTIGDQKCSKHANSISGHFSFHVFYFLSLQFLMVRLKRDPTNLNNYFGLSGHLHKLLKVRARTKGLLLTFFIFTLSSFWTLTRTWYFGFHSQGQIINGILFGLLSHGILSLCLTERNITNATGLIIALALFHALAMGSVKQHSGSFLYTSQEFMLDALMWVILVMSRVRRGSKSS